MNKVRANLQLNFAKILNSRFWISKNCQDPEFKILYCQNREFKILHCQNREFKIDDYWVRGIRNSYPRLIATYEVLLKLGYLQGSAPFVWYNRGIFQYFAKR